MAESINRLSFYMSWVCGVFVIILSFHSISYRIIMWIGIHPLEIALYFALTVLLLGIIGFSGIYNWKAALRSIFTVGFTLVLIVFLAYILFVGDMSR
ncbi:hypothetical protein [Bacillus dakarensis]|uniref:hypothetical protein n=1 Tax=Robertmurraya dakarensis TaxID=1926278 RepID=UPI000981E2F8|nr:hypothetical protein [Bacillus dakarensis]